MHRLRWDDLQYVHAVVERGSLSAAARSLGVNHATVHRRIGALEEAFGINLFERLPGGYRLRPEGRDVLGALDRIDSETARIERSFRGFRHSIEGTFRLTTTDTIATLLLPRHLAALRATHPDVRIELRITNHRVDMAEPVAEIALRPIRQLPENMSGEQAGHLRFGIFGSRTYLAEHPGGEHGDHQWLGVTPTIARSPAGQWQSEHLDGSPALTADSFFPLATMAEAGMGLAMLPEFVARNYPRLVPATRFPVEALMPFWVAAHKNLHALESIRVLIAFLADALRADPALAP